MANLRALTFLVVVLPFGAACVENTHFYGPFAMGIQPGVTPPALSGGDLGEYYEVRHLFEVPAAQPATPVLAALATPNAPWPRTPWITRHDFEMELAYTVSNLSDRAVTVTLVLDGYNEYVEYVPPTFTEDDETIVLLSLVQRLIRLGPYERRNGVLTEGDLDEAEVDLATAYNGLQTDPLFNYQHAVYSANHSANPTNLLDRAYIPSVVPGMLGLFVGIRTLGTSHVALEYTVRVRDVNRKLRTDATEGWWDRDEGDFAPLVFPGAYVP